VTELQANSSHCKISAGNTPVQCRACLIVVAALLPGCASRDPVVRTHDTRPAGNWQIEKQIDRITGTPLESALLTAASSHAIEPFPKKVTLQLACFNKKPLVRFAFETKVATTTSNEFGYRFDDKAGHEIAVRFFASNTVAVFKDEDVPRFLDELAAAKTLYVRIRSLGLGRTAAEFNVAGATAAMAATTAHCPPIAEEPKPKPKKPQR
jgi:hypothetical protein